MSDKVISFKLVETFETSFVNQSDLGHRKCQERFVNIEFLKDQNVFWGCKFASTLFKSASYWCEKENKNIFYKKRCCFVTFPKLWEGFKSCNCLSMQQVNHVPINFSQLMTLVSNFFYLFVYFVLMFHKMGLWTSHFAYLS